MWSCAFASRDDRLVHQFARVATALAALPAAGWWRSCSGHRGDDGETTCSAGRPRGGDAVPSVPKLMVASFVDGSLFAGAVLAALRAGGAEPAPCSPWLDGRDRQVCPSWRETRPRIRAEAPDPSQEARPRRIAWWLTLFYLAGLSWRTLGPRAELWRGSGLRVAMGRHAPSFMRSCASARRRFANSRRMRSCGLPSRTTGWCGGSSGSLRRSPRCRSSS